MRFRKCTLVTDRVRPDKVVAPLPNAHKIQLTGPRDDNRVLMCELSRPPTGNGPKQDAEKCVLLNQSNPGKIIFQDELCKPELSNKGPSKEDIEWAILVSMSFI